MKETRPVSAKLAENVDFLKQHLGIGESFDVLVREFKVGGKAVALFFIDGFAKDDVLVWIMQSLFRVQREQIAVKGYEKLIQHHLLYIETGEIRTLDEAEIKILSGALVLFIDGETTAIEIDAGNTRPARRRSPMWSG